MVKVQQHAICTRLRGQESSCRPRCNEYALCRKRSQVPHLRTVAPVRIVGYSGQERLHEPAAPETAYKNEVEKS